MSPFTTYESQRVLFFLFLLLFLTVHFYFLPYRNRRINLLESLSLFVLVLLSGIFASSSFENEPLGSFHPSSSPFHLATLLCALLTAFVLLLGLLLPSCLDVYKRISQWRAKKRQKPIPVFRHDQIWLITSDDPFSDLSSVYAQALLPRTTTTTTTTNTFFSSSSDSSSSSSSLLSHHSHPHVDSTSSSSSSPSSSSSLLV
jgi:hypothetical protein